MAAVVGAYNVLNVSKEKQTTYQSELMQRNSKVSAIACPAIDYESLGLFTPPYFYTAVVVSGCLSCYPMELPGLTSAPSTANTPPPTSPPVIAGEKELYILP